jgi:hypothetical protein
MAIRLFGFNLGKKEVTQVEKPEQASFVMPQAAVEDGAITVQSGAYYGTYVDLEGSVRNELELITRYREMSLHAECEAAIDEIISESITIDTDDGEIVDINMDKLKQPDSIKKKIREEFQNVKRMLNFSNLGDEIYRRWYIDGRINYHIIVNEKQPKQGIQELRFIDPRKIRKVREIQKGKDPRTGAELITSITEYYVYNDRGMTTQGYTANATAGASGIRIAPDSIINVNSGLMDAKNTMVLGYLHKAIKPLNQLRMTEDAIVIYRLSRAPERRVFYIDVGNLPKLKAEQYLRDIMVKYRNKLVYDANTGEIKDERKHLSMLEDFWLPRREGGKGTEITTLPAGQNLGELQDVQYFQKKLYQSLNVPVGRLDTQPGGMVGLGRVTEVTRDEVKFAKFVNRLRNKFCQLFDGALKVQLSLKGICTTEEWDEIKESIWYDFKKDNNFAEMREAELLRERLNLVATVDPYIGKYFSLEWVRKNVLQQSDDEIEEMQKQIEEEQKLFPELAQPSGPNGQPVPPEQEQPAPVPGEGTQLGDLTGVDNTADNSAESNGESLTPMLDSTVDKLSTGINKSKK